MLTLILGVLLAGGALWLLIYLARIMLNAAGFPMTGAFERWWFRRHVEHLRQADALLLRDDIDAALPRLRAAFCLTVFKDLNLARSVTNHHTAILSRLLSVTAEGVRPLSLAKVDRLLRERTDLQRSYIAARQSPGKQQRRRELQGRLDANRRELEPVLSQLIEETRRSLATPMYH